MHEMQDVPGHGTTANETEGHIGTYRNIYIILLISVSVRIANVF